MEILDYQHSVIRSLLHMLIQTLEDAGESVDSLRQYMEIIDSQDLLAQCGRVKGSSFLPILALLLNNDKKPFLVLNMVNNYRPVTFNALGPLCYSCETVRENIELLIKHYSMISTGAEVYLKKTDDSWFVGARSRHHKLNESKMQLAWVCNMYAHLKFSVSNEFIFHKVCLSIPRPEQKYVEEINAVFNTEVEFDCEDSGFYLTTGQLDIEQVGFDPQIYALNQKLVDEYEQRFEYFELPTRIYSNILELMKKGVFSKEAIARELGMSTRSLSQKIKQFGLNYRDISENARMTLAKEYLSNLDLKLVEVAEKLCFSENSNFTRSFKAHSGQTPREFRAKLKVT
ncbi:helix-turn-helix domain-containing protein [Thalassotalea psychrophila]|uniref:Helix-turn-helix domain-containing protein n=1 Tax=Thalassotalea psychrophila TaxID=3065647 RepID=A0ABY9TZ03_9GAMM|nr:helix-turn-helix domain-containing protein [Colwelliaceae bacterium SQ149]